MGYYKIVGIDAEHKLIFEHNETKERYTSGDTLEQFGPDNLTEDEKKLIETELNRRNLGSECFRNYTDDQDIDGKEK